MVVPLPLRPNLFHLKNISPILPISFFHFLSTSSPCMLYMSFPDAENPISITSESLCRWYQIPPMLISRHRCLWSLQRQNQGWYERNAAGLGTWVTWVTVAPQGGSKSRWSTTPLRVHNLQVSCFRHRKEKKSRASGAKLLPFLFLGRLLQLLPGCLVKIFWTEDPKLA